jgi:tRNA A-37 threonylcarbamoyl transferase component Bud32
MTATTPKAEPAGIVGSTISGRYRIERLLGEGGMGAVYEAEHTLMHKRVAIKVLHAEMSKMTEVVSRFEREAMAAAHIEHPNVASATDFGKLDDGSFFLVLELIEGASLREAIAKGRFPVARAVHVVRQIAGALSRAHGLGIVHRDLKPENVMLVARDGDPDFVKVLDFGIAKVPVGGIGAATSSGEQALTKLGMVYGTPEYMPPEQALGQEVDRRADLYALGVVMYEMLAGVRPFDDESKVKLLGKHISAPVPPLPPDALAPPEIEALVMKLLAKDLNDRVQEARDVIAALDAIESRGAEPRASSGALPPMSSGALPAQSSGAFANPTVLALETHAKSLAGEVTRVVPSRVLVPLLWVLAVTTFASVVAVVAYVSLPRGQPSSSSGQATAPVEPDGQFDRELKEAQGELGSGSYDAAIARARTLANDQPARPEPHHLLFQAHVAKGDTKAALADAEAWLAADSSAQSDAQLHDALKTALATRDDESAAFALLETGKLGPKGADVLYDAAYAGPQTPAAQRARHALLRPDIIQKASPALQIAVELRSTSSCEGKKALLDRAATQGDARALAVLETYAPTSGCGFLGTRDCWSCMHRDGSLSAATTKLRARVQ